MDLHFKRRSLAESFVGRQLEAILGRQMTEKRVNGYPVPSTEIGNGNRTNGNTRQRLHGLSSSRGLSQSSMQLGQSIPAPTPENNAKPKPFGGNGQGPKRVLRHYLSVDDSNIFRRPQQFRRATEKYVRPKSTFYIPSCADDGGINGGQGKNLIKSAAKSSHTNAANLDTGLLPNTRRQPKRRVSSIHRRSASVDDLLSSNNRNSNLMSFSSDDEDEQASRYFNQDASRSISAVTEVPVIRPTVVSSRTLTESATASSAAVTQNSEVAPVNSVTPKADLPLSANCTPETKAALPPAVLPVRRTVRPKAAICPIFPGMLPITSRAIPGAVSMAPVPVIPAAVPAASPVMSVAGPAETTITPAMTPGVCPVIPDTRQTECALILDLVSAATPLIPAGIPGVSTVIPAAVPPTSLVIPAAVPASLPVQLSPPISYEVAVAASPVLPLTPSRPVPAPRRFEPQQSYLDLIFDLMPTSSTATIATVPTVRPKPTRLAVQKPRSPRTRENPPINPAPVVETPLLVDLTDPTPNQRPGTNSDSDIRSSSSSSRSSLAEETSESAGGHRIRDPPVSGSSRSLDSIPSSSPGPEVTSRRMSLLEATPTRASASSSRALSDGPDIECCDTPGSLSMYDKIVWFTESGVPETGMVKWLGRIKSTFYAGVEFENHVGNSSGKIKGRRLFTTALTKGRFVPITELMLHKDFYEGFPYPTNAPADSKIMPKAAPQKFVSSVIMCVVCQEPLLNPDEDESAPDGSRVGSEAAAVPEQKEMIATPCGHLFHADCLKRWFNVNQKSRQPCPYCQNLMGVNEVIRIFPVQGKL